LFLNHNPENRIIDLILFWRKMERPIILKGEPFDWNEGYKHMLVANRSFADAMAADPGCVQCPGCKEYLWREGEKVECPHCHTQFEIKRDYQ
jgi:ssDNA-binding Zn-finger/Zn-ribbon topoisomerase 1